MPRDRGLFMNRLERALMDNTIRAASQRHLETRALLRLGGPLDGGRALEIGCGCGVGAELILERFGASTVDAFDYDLRAVAKARRRLLRRGMRAGTWVGDASALPVADRSYDAVFDFGVLHHLPDWRGGVRELARVLRPGGRLYGEEVLRSFVDHPVTRTFLDHPIADRFDASELEDALDTAGFSCRALEKRFLGTFVWFVAER